MGVKKANNVALRRPCLELFPLGREGEDNVVGPTQNQGRAQSSEPRGPCKEVRRGSFNSQVRAACAPGVEERKSRDVPGPPHPLARSLYQRDTPQSRAEYLKSRMRKAPWTFPDF